MHVGTHVHRLLHDGAAAALEHLRLGLGDREDLPWGGGGEALWKMLRTDSKVQPRGFPGLPLAHMCIITLCSCDNHTCLFVNVIVAK